MGILNEKDVFSPKWVTAEITDSKNNLHYVPIKHEIGDYFIAEIDTKFYVFTLRNARYLRYKSTLARSYQVVQFDTSHYSSIKAEGKELELMLLKNGLPKVDRMQHNVLRVLGRREKEPFKPLSIEELVAVFAEKGGSQYAKEIATIRDYFDELDIDHIVTPVQKVTDFLQGDFIATNPAFLGEAVPHYQRLDDEHKKISNTEIKGSRNLAKYMLIIMAVVVVVAIIFIGESEGWFDGIFTFTDNLTVIGEGFKGIPSPTQGIQTGGKADYSDASIQARYTPEALQVAIDNGEIEYAKLSSFMQGLVNDVQTPTVSGG